MTNQGEAIFKFIREDKTFQDHLKKNGWIPPEEAKLINRLKDRIKNYEVILKLQHQRILRLTKSQASLKGWGTKYRKKLQW